MNHWQGKVQMIQLSKVKSINSLGQKGQLWIWHLRALFAFGFDRNMTSIRTDTAILESHCSVKYLLKGFWQPGGLQICSESIDKIGIEWWQGTVCQGEELQYCPLTSLFFKVSVSVWRNIPSSIVINFIFMGSEWVGVALKAMSEALVRCFEHFVEHLLGQDF